jgi:ornithine cyclodeaminase
VLILAHDDVLAALPPNECADAMAEVLAAHARGEALMPLRTMVPFAGAAGFMGLMPAWRGGLDPVFALKSLCVMPGNPARGLDSHQGTVTLFDGTIGVPTAILDASAVTSVRTAAVSAVATRVLARDDARVLAILGAGVQAKAHLNALVPVREFAEVRVFSRSREHARQLADGRASCRRAPRRRSEGPTWSCWPRVRASRSSVTSG